MMNQDRKLDRKSFIASTVAAWATVALGGCSDDGEGGGTDNGGGATGGTSTTGGTATGGSATGGASTTGGTATGGTATGGSGGDVTYTCTTDTNNGMHSHPLTIPGSDIARTMQDAPYILEDGGTGHTHTLELSPYEWLFLRGGTAVTTVSSEDAGHSHEVVINCVQS
jgi:hypothetical protein